MKPNAIRHHSISLVLLAMLMGACAPHQLRVLRLATTTSTYDSGLLQEILPDFEKKHTARVEVLAVGTGQALALGERGDADVLLVHAKAKEEAFVQAGLGLARYPVMYNDFILVGPATDPAGIDGFQTASEALARIAATQSKFVSRGDDSGTHVKEQALWRESGIMPQPEMGWYASIGQGMGATLQFAQEQMAYTLTDRGTFLALKESLPDLVIMVGGDSIAENADRSLMNPYGVIPVNPAIHSGIQAELAQEFVEWLTALETQERIAQVGLDRFGQPLFYPDSDAWRGANP